jgi:hypothetical protein
VQPPTSPTASISPIPNVAMDNFELRAVSPSESGSSSLVESENQFSFTLNWSANGDAASNHSTSPLILSLSSSCSSVIGSGELVPVPMRQEGESEGTERESENGGTRAPVVDLPAPFSFAFPSVPSLASDSPKFVGFGGLKVAAPSPKGPASPLAGPGSVKRNRRHQAVVLSSPMTVHQTPGASSSDNSTDAKRNRSSFEVSGQSGAVNNSKESRASVQSIHTVLHHTPPSSAPVDRQPIVGAALLPSTQAENRSLSSRLYVQSRLQALRAQLHDLSLSVDHSFDSNLEESTVVSPAIEKMKPGEATVVGAEVLGIPTGNSSRPQSSASDPLPTDACDDVYASVLQTLRELRMQLKEIEVKVDRIPTESPQQHRTVLGPQTRQAQVSISENVVFYEDVPPVGFRMRRDPYKRLIDAPVCKTDGSTVDWEDFESELDAEVEALHVLSKIKLSSV